MDRAGLAVHHLTRPHHFAAEGLADALVAKADTEQWQLAGEALDHGQRDAGLVGGAGTGGKDDALGRQGLDLFHAQFVVAHHLDLGLELAEVLHQVVGEGVVVIDHQQHAGCNLLISFLCESHHPAFATPGSRRARGGRGSGSSALCLWKTGDAGRRDRPGRRRRSQARQRQRANALMREVMMLLRWITIAVSRSHVGEHSPVGRMGATAGCREERRPERPAQGMLLSRQASGWR